MTVTDDLMQPAAIAADAVGVLPVTLRVWVARGHISPPVNGRYDLRELVAWTDKRSHRHAVSARHQRHTTRGACDSVKVV